MRLGAALESEVQVEVGGYRLAFERCGLEAVLAGGLEGVLIEAPAQALDDMDLGWDAVLVDHQRDLHCP